MSEPAPPTPQVVEIGAKAWRALQRLQPYEVHAYAVTPATIPEGLGCRPGDYIEGLTDEDAARWIAAGLIEVVPAGQVPLVREKG